MKAGYCAIIGKTNSGKSTLMNKLIGQKISIVSFKKQTTRDNIIGILNKKDCQIVFVDTPGIHRTINALDRKMMKEVRAAAEGVDVIVYLIDASKKFSDEEIAYISDLAEKTDNLILACSKTDLTTFEKSYAEIAKLNKLNVKDIIPISTFKNRNLEILTEKIIACLPEGQPIFPSDEITDKPITFMVGEIIREKALNLLDEEIPHGIMVEVKSYTEKKKIVEIFADIICEKDSHKNIIIGKGGEMLKQIGMRSRIDIEKLVGRQVDLKLWVRVEKDWRLKKV